MEGLITIIPEGCKKAHPKPAQGHQLRKKRRHEELKVNRSSVSLQRKLDKTPGYEHLGGYNLGRPLVQQAPGLVSGGMTEICFVLKHYLKYCGHSIISCEWATLPSQGWQGVELPLGQP